MHLSTYTSRLTKHDETAVRIIKTAKQLGIKTISIYTAADAASQHVSHADEAVLLSGSNSAAYTDGDQIIAIAKEKKANAVIPGMADHHVVNVRAHADASQIAGYGFLSENAQFARAVGEAGLVWVGPSPEAIEGSYHGLEYAGCMGC